MATSQPHAKFKPFILLSAAFLLSIFLLRLSRSFAILGVSSDIVSKTGDVTPSPLPPPVINPATHPINWIILTASIKATDFYVESNGQKYNSQDALLGKTAQLIQPGSTSQILGVFWQEKGQGIKILYHFNWTNSNWSVNAIDLTVGTHTITYHPQGELLAPLGNHVFKSNFTQTGYLTSDHQNWLTLHFQNLDLSFGIPQF